jgi:SAM-dependent methyltransferase
LRSPDEYRVLGIDDVARVLGVTEGDVEKGLGNHRFPRLKFRSLTALERDHAILTVLRRLEQDLPRSGIDDPERWERGWGEILERARREGIGEAVLRPQYFSCDVLRYDGDYIKVLDASFEYDLYTVIKRTLFTKHLHDFRSVVEFGCGTGASLLLLGELYPDMALTGCDWARPSHELVKMIGKQSGRRIDAIYFNMLTLEGREDVKMDERTVVVTIHSLEQLGSGFEPMLQFLTEAGPGLCLHLEPVIELYQSGVLFDELAIRWHRKRNYLGGFLTALRKLERVGAASILEVRRLGFGSMFHEGYSLIIWKPVMAPRNA